MPIRKQEFYEGAALHVLAKSGLIRRVAHEPPLFIFNESISVLIKYSTRGRSPGGFTFTTDEQLVIRCRSTPHNFIIALACGSDGIAAIPATDYEAIALPRENAIHIACYRDFGQQYSVKGPDGTLGYKVPPSAWERILENGWRP